MRPDAFPLQPETAAPLAGAHGAALPATHAARRSTGGWRDLIAALCATAARFRPIVPVLLAASFAAPARAASGPPDYRPGRPLTMADRAWCVERIERVYDAHRLWPRENAAPKPPFEREWTPAALRARAESQLRMGEALAEQFGEFVTPAQLQSELDRISRDSRAPGILRELFQSLGDDPRLAAECLARPLVTERRLRARHEEAAGIRGTPAKGETIPTEAGTGGMAVDFDAWLRELGPARPLTGRAPDEGTEAAVYRIAAPEAPTADCNQWAAPRAAAPEARSGHTAVWTGSEMILWGGGFGAQYGIGWRYAPATDTWTALPSSGAPASRLGHSAVWSGSDMIVWGGYDTSFSSYTATGASYNPAGNAWTALPAAGAPAARAYHTAVWTGSQMVVWGGFNGGRLATGGRFVPGGAWSATTTTGAPTARYRHTAVWTGTVMVVWGGDVSGSPYTNTGSRYNPVSDSWAATTTTNAPESRINHTAVLWAGGMMVWGGSNFSVIKTGGIYNASTDSWSGITAFAGAARQYHTAVVTPSAVLFWGGHDGTNYLNETVRFDGGWLTLGNAGAPAPRTGHAAVWSGTEMIVWGGGDASQTFDDGSRFNPNTYAWTRMTGGNPPAGRTGHGAVWTGTEMIVWGGYNGGYLNTGARYLPALDTWIPMSMSGAPAGRYGHTAVWTGSRMVIWGGTGAGGASLNSGGRYTPATDSWASVTTTGAPSVRYGHTAIWSGSRMVVWGGYDAGSKGDGGRYDPTADAWSTVSASGAPVARYGHTAVWTGGLMLVWGGNIDSSPFVTGGGGRYDPAGDLWYSMNTAGAPSARAGHTAVWTGNEMIIWGNQTSTSDTSGGRYSVAGDSWTATNLTGAPSGRYGHTAVWTGKEMLVWGGADTGFLATGGRYNPAGNSWSALATVGAPEARYRHTAIWTGSEMLVWGGQGASGYLATQGRYRPNTPEFTVHPSPASQTLCGGETVSFTASANFAASLRWQRNGTPLSDGGAYSGTSTGTLTITNFSAGEAGDYALVATNACGASASSTASLLGGGYPSGLSNNTATDPDLCVASGNAVAWSAPSSWNDNGGTRAWQVFRNGSAVASGPCSGNLAASTLNCTDTTAAPGVSYTYRVQAVNSCGLGSATSGASSIDRAGSVPSGLSNNGAADASACLASGNSVSWTAPSAWNDNGAGTRGWIVLRDGTPIPAGPCAGTLAEASLNCTDSGATPAQSHTYAVRAVNGCSLNATTTGAAAADLADATPPLMSVLGAGKSGANLLFDWTAGAPSDALSYRVYQSPTLGPASWSTGYAGATTAWTDGVDLPGDTSWFFTATALDGCGNESPQ